MSPEVLGWPAGLQGTLTPGLGRAVTQRRGKARPAGENLLLSLLWPGDQGPLGQEAVGTSVGLGRGVGDDLTQRARGGPTGQESLPRQWTSLQEPPGQPIPGAWWPEAIVLTSQRLWERGGLSPETHQGGHHSGPIPPSLRCCSGCQMRSLSYTLCCVALGKWHTLSEP